MTKFSTPRKILVLSLLLLAILCSQTGCWDRLEVEKLIIVTGIGIEPAPEGRVRVIIQTLNPKAVTKGSPVESGSGGVTNRGPFRNASAEGENVLEAIRKVSLEAPRRLFCAHIQVILLSEDLVQERDVHEVLDFFDRDYALNRKTWLLVVRGADLSKVMSIPGELDPTPTMRLAGIIQERTLNSQYAPMQVGDFLEMMENGLEPFTAVVELVPNQAYPPGSKGDPQLETEPAETLKINGTAVFREDRLAGWLNLTESRGLLWVRDKVKGGIIDVPGLDTSGELISLEITGSNTKLQPDFRDDQIYMTVDVQVDSKLIETKKWLDLRQPEILKSLETLQAQAIKAEIESALDRAQKEYQADVFGFGEAIHHEYPHEWEEIKGQWSNMFSKIPVQVRVQCKIRHTGLVTLPMETKESSGR